MNSSTRKNSFWAEIIYRGVESDELDYKAHQSWNALSRAGKGKITRHLTALANTKGGYIVIGVGEDASGEPALYTGLSNAESRSFDPTAVGSFVHQCVEPPIDFTIERPKIDGKRYAIFCVKPFSTLPHVCCRGIESELHTGVFYIRTPDASSRPAYRAIEVQQIIQRALRNQREMLGRMLRGILYEHREIPDIESGKSGFADAASAALDFFRRRKHSDGPAVLFQLTVTPEKFNADAWTFGELRRAAENSWRWQPEELFIADGEIKNAYNTNVSLRALPKERLKMWQLFKSGLFHYVAWLPAPDNRLNSETLRKLVFEALEFLGRFYNELVRPEELLTLELKLEPMQKYRLLLPDGSECHTRIPRLETGLKRSAADLAVGWSVHAIRLLRGVGERFNADENQLRQLTGSTDKKS